MRKNDIYMFESWGEVLYAKPVWNIQMQLNFDLSVFRPAKERGLLTVFRPSNIVYSIKDGMEIVWDSRVKSKAVKLILGDKRLYHFNKDYFKYDASSSKWSSLNNRIQFKIEKAVIDESVVFKILSMCILMFYRLISPQEFNEGLQRFRSYFDFEILYCKDTYLLVRAVPVLTTQRSP